VAAALQAEGAVLTKKTDGGALSADDDVLKSLSQTSAVAALVLEARTSQKLLSAYFENFLEFRDGDILHPHINQLAARTGRMSVTEPALQQVPRKSLVRDAFIPREGNKLVLIDYENQELRVAAHYSGDPTMLAAFAEGRDLHMETAVRLYGAEATREHRNIAKSAMFAKAYGAGIEKFAATAGISYGQAQGVFMALDQAYPELNRCMAKVTQTVRARGGGSGFGWVVLPDGRKLRVRADKAYVGFNALIQGTCATVLKRSLVDLDAAGFGPYMVLPIHDEGMFDVPEHDVDDVVPELRRIMTREDFRAPLLTSAKVVSRWGDPYRAAA
jgi:DNA polymerase-1